MSSRFRLWNVFCDWTIGLFLFLGTSTPALAVLGDNDASIEKDAKSFGVTRTIATHPQFNVHEIAPQKLTLHEFSASDGNVFAVAWKGKTHPDLSTLLGSNLSEFQQAISQARGSGRNRRRGGMISIDSQNLHIELGGHMMSAFGRVWLKNQMPSGVNSNDIR